MTGRLYLVRHGETTANVGKILDTRPPGAALTADGHAQASAFGLNREVDPGAVTLISSVARRAQQTAAGIARHWQVPVHVRDGLHEIQAGDLEGQGHRLAHEAFRDLGKRWWDGDLEAKRPEGESVVDLLARYLPVLEQIRTVELEKGDVYVVSHGAAIRLVAGAITNVDRDFAHRRGLANTDHIEFMPAGDGWELVSWAGEDPNATGESSPVDPMG